jgi:hypothetical protein
MRDIETIDGDLGLVARAWRVARVLCDRMPAPRLIDQLLDERAASSAVADARQRRMLQHRSGPSKGSGAGWCQR